MPENFFRFEPIIYPIWRRSMPEFVRQLANPLLRSAYPVQADVQAPTDEATMARFLVDWDLFPDAELNDLATQLSTISIPCSVAERDAAAQPYEGAALRIPAQWEPTERVLVSWGRMYPTIWEMHAQLVEAISAVASAEILVPTELWARAVALYLRERGKAKADNLCFTVLRTDDIWVRDYGPIVAQAADGQRVVVAARYDNHPEYPQADDDRMARRWAAHHGLPLLPLKLHTEGGNLWSDRRPPHAGPGCRARGPHTAPARAHGGSRSLRPRRAGTAPPRISRSSRASDPAGSPPRGALPWSRSCR
ncbi:MAG: agmatine deiminase family protein [Anaerolineae bacterium]|nr:agmatine deiminase family protein [Anaerolineae bacterium]